MNPVSPTAAHVPAAYGFPDDVTLGIGAWAWGDQIMWGYGSGYAEADVRAAYETALAHGVRLFDTAEIYGFGTSERLLGSFMRATDTRPRIATKFAPIPGRFGKGAVVGALQASLKRLGLDQVDLYQIHFPTPLVSIDVWLHGLADALDAGLTRAAGVSNFDAGQTERAHTILSERGYRLASNQVEYSLLQRRIERDGVMRVCQALDVRVIAYSPLAMGLLTGKYKRSAPPKGVRGLQFRGRLDAIQPLLTLMREIGARHGKTPAQVAINWTVAKGSVPIPGAKNARQAEDNAAAVGWSLTANDVAALDAESGRL